MGRIAVRCTSCPNDEMSNRGEMDIHTQRSRCHNPASQGHLPDLKPLVMAMSLTARGGRDTARGLQSSTDTVMQAVKKRRNTHLRPHTDCARLQLARLSRVDTAEVKERWGCRHAEGPVVTVAGHRWCGTSTS
jgi:hypothetical protein